MKKIFTVMLMAVCAILYGYADITKMKGDLIPVNLIVHYETRVPRPIFQPRTPIRMPEVYLSESTIIFENGVFCNRIVLVDADNNIVYDVDTTEVSGDSIALPSYLTGEYGIYFICENYYFYGEIEL